MTKKEYMEKLNEVLLGVEEEIAKEIIEDYHEHFAMGLNNGKTEEQICEELGDIEELVNELNGLKTQGNEIRTEQNQEGLKVTEVAGKLEKEDETKESIEVEKIQGIVEERKQSAEVEKDTLSEVEGKQLIEESKLCSVEVSTENTDKESMQDVKENATLNKANSEGNQDHGKSNSEEDQDHGKSKPEEDQTSRNKEDNHGINGIIVDALFADVYVIPSGSNQVTINYTNFGDDRQKMMYEFKSWQEGNQIFAKLIRKESGFGFFNYIKTPRMKIEVRLPEYLLNLTITSTSGEVILNGAKNNQVRINTMSGDIRVSMYQATQMQLQSQSGDIQMQNCTGDVLNCNTTSGDYRISDVTYREKYLDTCSGDIQMERTQCDNLTGRTKSGDVSLRDMRIKFGESSTLSGDVTISRVSSERFTMKSTSGDVRAEDCSVREFSINSTSGDVTFGRVKSAIIQTSSKSGDVRATAEVEEFRASSISGDVTLTVESDAKIHANSVSGDVDLLCNNHGNGYEANIRTVSGSKSLSFDKDRSNLYKNGSYIFGNGGCKIEAHTTSGDIRIRG